MVSSECEWDSGWATASSECESDLESTVTTSGWEWLGSTVAALGRRGPVRGRRRLCRC